MMTVSRTVVGSAERGWMPEPSRHSSPVGALQQGVDEQELGSAARSAAAMRCGVSESKWALSPGRGRGTRVPEAQPEPPFQDVEPLLAGVDADEVALRARAGTFTRSGCMARPGVPAWR